jgi:hypothetical protein
MLNPPQVSCSHAGGEPTIVTLTLTSRVGGTHSSRQSLCDACLVDFIARLQRAAEDRRVYDERKRWILRPSSANFGAHRGEISG